MIDDFVKTPSSMTGFQTGELYRMQVRDVCDYAMFMVDTNNVLRTWNAGVERLLGYSEQEWLGQNACMIFTPRDVEAGVCEAEMEKARNTGSATNIRWHRRKDGGEIFGNGRLTAVRDQQGQLVGFTKILSDETARKQLEDSLTESNSALEQFAYVASHDLQEPLRTMSAYAQLLSRRYGNKLDADADQFLGFILSAAERMSALVRDLLAYARLSSGDERPASVALDEDFEAALALLDHAIKESGASVTHDSLPIVQVDRGQMVRLFQNLVGNAVKYRKPGQHPKVHVQAEHKGAEWVISVKDNGIGFDPNHASTIFAPFKRLHTAEEYPGTGVGLAICRRIVQAHGGRIWAESQPGEGTTIFFTLPAPA